MVPPTCAFQAVVEAQVAASVAHLWDVIHRQSAIHEAPLYLIPAFPGRFPELALIRKNVMHARSSARAWYAFYWTKCWGEHLRMMCMG